MFRTASSTIEEEIAIKVMEPYVDAIQEMGYLVDCDYCPATNDEDGFAYINCICYQDGKEINHEVYEEIRKALREQGLNYLWYYIEY